MLTQLATVKQRLALQNIDTQYDDLLTRVIGAVSGRFDLECNRTLARTIGATHEFPIRDTENPVPCYPIETVVRFETKATEALGWVEQPDIDYIIRGRCVVSLYSLLPIPAPEAQLARLIYTGGYVLPGNTPEPGQAALPADLENAAIEQIAFWFQRRDNVGVIRIWPSGGNYMQLVDTDLLPAVRAVLRKHARFNL